MLVVKSIKPPALEAVATRFRGVFVANLAIGMEVKTDIAQVTITYPVTSNLVTLYA